jgi:tripartite-type tricarboxylate transporter receptor subunit TctC
MGPVLSLGRQQVVGAGLMKFPRRRFLQLAVGAAVVPVSSKMAAAQTWPVRPVRLIVGYTPGGSADLTARLMGQWLSDRLGQSIIIENRPGGGTNIATEAAVRSAAWLHPDACCARKRHQCHAL